MGLPPSPVPTSNTSRRQLTAHPSAALISRVQNFRRKMCRTPSAPSSHSRPGDGLFARRTEGSNLARSTGESANSRSLPRRNQTRTRSRGKHSSKAEPDQADSLACHILPRRWCGCEKSAAFVSVLDGDGHWVEYNDPVYGERRPEATSGGPIRRESHDGRDDAP